MKFFSIKSTPHFIHEIMNIKNNDNNVRLRVAMVQCSKACFEHFISAILGSILSLGFCALVDETVKIPLC
jgi:hypothetical protein